MIPRPLFGHRGPERSPEAPGRRPRVPKDPHNGRRSPQRVSKWANIGPKWTRMTPQMHQNEVLGPLRVPFGTQMGPQRRPRNTFRRIWDPCWAPNGSKHIHPSAIHHPCQRTINPVLCDNQYAARMQDIHHARLDEGGVFQRRGREG